MSDPEFKSLSNSSFSFPKQHTQSPPQNNHFSCESSKSISSSLLSHSSHWIQECDWMNDIPSFLIHHTSHITLHHSSLSWWANHLKCFDVVWFELGGCDDVFDERWEWKGNGGDCYEGWCWWNEQHMCCCCWETWLMSWCGVNERDGKIRSVRMMMCGGMRSVSPSSCLCFCHEWTKENNCEIKN